MKNLIRLTQAGLQTFYVYEDRFMVFLSGKPLCAAINELPKNVKKEIGDSMPEKVFGHKYLGNGKILKVFRGNCSGSVPYQFENIQEAIECFKKVRWEKQGKKEKAKVFCGNMWVGNIINDEYKPLERPIMQLL
jgi:hypothetical protein